MRIEWNKVTWYSKTLAVLVFIATFLIGFTSGSLYRQSKDSSTISLLATEQSTSTAAVSAEQALQSATTTIQVPPTATHYDGMLICTSNNGCPNGYSCLRQGPLIVGEVPPKVCVPKGQAIPL